MIHRGIESYDILKNPKYRNIFSDAEYIPQADSSRHVKMSPLPICADTGCYQ